jgi:hypothetical protein
MPDYRQSPLSKRFSLRTMLVVVALVSAVVWLSTQINWLRQRRAWRNFGPPAMRSTKSESAPGFLGLLGEGGESWIEIKNGTPEQIAEAKRLFPEATVVIAGGPPVHSNETPAVSPVEPIARPVP